MVHKDTFTLEPEQFIEFTEEGIFFCIRNEGDKPKIVKIIIEDCRKEKK
jgi:hypothetical protein